MGTRKPGNPTSAGAVAARDCRVHRLVDDLWPAFLACRADVLDGGPAREDDWLFAGPPAGGEGSWSFRTVEAGAPFDPPASARCVCVAFADGPSAMRISDRIPGTGHGHAYAIDGADGTPVAVANRGGETGRPGSVDDLSCFELYLPFLVAARTSAVTGRTFVCAHMAQTMDGRIATESGHSRWISGEADLVHAHRLRALHDAVLVGARTLRNDDPRLTVRKVEGADPIRVVVTGTGETGVLAHRCTRLPGTTLILSPAAETDEVVLAADEEREVLSVRMESDASGHVPTVRIVKTLEERGIRTLFVEGGGITVSHFVREARIDLLHLLVAPITLGSGIPGIALPKVDRIGDGVAWRLEHFDLDGEILFVLRPRSSASWPRGAPGR